MTDTEIAALIPAIQKEIGKIGKPSSFQVFGEYEYIRLAVELLWQVFTRKCSGKRRLCLMAIALILTEIKRMDKWEKYK